MIKYNPANERIKREYFAYLREAKRQSDGSLSAAAKALSRFEESTHFKDFRNFHIQQAVAFKRKLAQQPSLRTGKGLSKATLYSTLHALRSFFIWLAGKPGFKSRISYSDADYFNLSETETRIAKAHREQRAPTLQQIHHVLSIMPRGGEIERRNRAIVAFTLLSGARDGALATFKLKHIDLNQERVIHDARDVSTKFSKSFITWFFPVGGGARDIVVEWVRYLRMVLLWGDDDPLFPATSIEIGKSRRFEVLGLERKAWSTTAPIRRIFRLAFESADLPYFNPHSFRKTLAQLGEGLCRTPEEFKAWSQNLGHDGVMTTFNNYGSVALPRQGEIIRGLGIRNDEPATPTIADVMAKLNSLEKVATPLR
jgi:integrase